jgi:hypothetical protein
MKESLENKDYREAVATPAVIDRCHRCCPDFCRFFDCAGTPFGVMLLALGFPSFISECGFGGHSQ